MPFRVGDSYSMPDGLASAPGLAFESDPSTGLYRKSAGVVGLAAGGVEVGSFDANGLGGGVYLKDVILTQTSGDGVYTATAALPANNRILDVGATALALWTDTSASLIVGDDDNPDGFFEATDLKAGDLLVGETNNIQHPGGKAGAYIVSEQRLLFSAAARNVIFEVTQVGTGTAGRTRGYVLYAVGVPVTAVKV